MKWLLTLDTFDTLHALDSLNTYSNIVVYIYDEHESAPILIQQDRDSIPNCEKFIFCLVKTKNMFVRTTSCLSRP